MRDSNVSNGVKTPRNSRPHAILYIDDNIRGEILIEVIISRRARRVISKDVPGRALPHKCCRDHPAARVAQSYPRLEMALLEDAAALYPAPPALPHPPRYRYTLDAGPQARDSAAPKHAFCFCRQARPVSGHRLHVAIQCHLGFLLASVAHCMQRTSFHTLLEGPQAPGQLLETVGKNTLRQQGVNIHQKTCPRHIFARKCTTGRPEEKGGGASKKAHESHACTCRQHSVKSLCNTICSMRLYEHVTSPILQQMKPRLDVPESKNDSNARGTARVHESRAVGILDPPTLRRKFKSIAPLWLPPAR